MGLMVGWSTAPVQTEVSQQLGLLHGFPLDSRTDIHGQVRTKPNDCGGGFAFECHRSCGLE